MPALALLAGAAAAHEMSMAEMELREAARGDFLWQWTVSGNKPAGEVLTPVWPESCRAEANVLRCGEAGLRGTLAIEGVGKRYSAAMVKVFWLDGQSRVYTITAGQPTVQLYGSAEDRRGMGEIARAYTVLGIEHILTGFDHLLFVVALLFLVGFNRQLVFALDRVHAGAQPDPGPQRARLADLAPAAGRSGDRAVDRAGCRRGVARQTDAVAPLAGAGGFHLRARARPSVSPAR